MQLWKNMVAYFFVHYVYAKHSSVVLHSTNLVQVSVPS